MSDGESAYVAEMEAELAEHRRRVARDRRELKARRRAFGQAVSAEDSSDASPADPAARRGGGGPGIGPGKANDKRRKGGKPKRRR